MQLRPEQTLLSVVAGLSIAEMQAAAGPDVTIVRAIPVTAAEVCRSPNIFFPANDVIETILSHCGTAIVLSSEADFDAAGVLACVYGWYLGLYDTLISASVAAGLDEHTSRQVVLGMAEGAAAVAAAQEDQSVNAITRKIASEGSFTKLGLDHIEAADALRPWREAHAKVFEAFRQS